MKPGPDVKAKRQQFKEKRQELETEKKALLAGHGYPEDFLERKYRCNICKDTGYTDEGRVCTCAKERAEEAYEWIRRTGNR
jgi:DNA replication protein DnaC